MQVSVLKPIQFAVKNIAIDKVKLRRREQFCVYFDDKRIDDLGCHAGTGKVRASQFPNVPHSQLKILPHRRS